MRPRTRAAVLAGLMVGFLFGWCATIAPSRAQEVSPAAPRPKTGRPWADMDYGPFLTASIEAPRPATNLAFKGIAIRVADAFGGAQNEAVVFDTDLLRYSAGWTGNFVALKGVVFDGEHWAYPRIDGEQVFGNPAIPGWAKDGSFADPRAFIYGPLPRDWAHWKGLYLHEQKVVLSYTVGGVDVLEMPGLEKGGGLTAFSRTLNVGPSGQDLTLQVAFEQNQPLRLLSLDSVKEVSNETSAGDSIVVLGQTESARPRPPQPMAPSDDGLLGKWSFDEGRGEVAVSQAPVRHAWKLRNHRWAPGRSGTALALAGKGFGELDPAEDIEFLQSDLTFAAWIKTTRDGTIISQTAPQGPWVPDGKTLFISGGKLTFDVGWVSAVASERSVTGGRWTHVAMTWSHTDGVVRLYVNGAPDKRRVLKPKKPTVGHVFRVGFTATNFPDAPYFNGQLDDLRLYRRKLGDAEIESLAAGVREDDGVLAVGVVAAPKGARWITTPAGHARLGVPASASTARFKVLIARVAPDALPKFAQLVKQAGRLGVPPVPPGVAPENVRGPDAQRTGGTPVLPEAGGKPALLADLKPLTKGGPPRWPQTLTTQARRGADAGPYAIDRIVAPNDNPWNSWMHFGGFDFFNDATRAAICTWNGDVWLVSGLDDTLERLTWQRIATGLFQPLGLKIVDDQIYVLGRDQITRLHDLNGDGETDFYENFNNDCMTAEHFHEFAMDLQTDTTGNFYFMKGARHARDAQHPHHGTFIKVSKDGARLEVIAKGFRAPNGLEVAPNNECFTTDQEGYWMPANRLSRIEPGKFYGNTWSWFPEGKPTSYDPPICWLHPKVDRSPSTMAWVTSSRWGLAQDSLLSVSYGVGRIFLVMRETVDGVEQGGVVMLPPEFETGIMRSRFSPRDGQFYVCGLFGWAGNKTQAGGFYRVRYTGQPLRLPRELHATTNGVVLAFTDPLDPTSATDARNYSVEVWNYKWTANYGSPDFKLNGEKGRDRLMVESAQLSKDGRTLFLKLPGICPVMQMNIQMNVKAADGVPIKTFVHNTIHRLGRRPGESWLGGQAIASAQAVQPALQQEAPGLVRTITAQGASDTHVSRLVALNVPAGSSATPFLPPGPFVSTWTGFVKLDLSESFVFQAVGRGRVTVKVNDELAVPPGELGSGAGILPATSGLPAREVVAARGQDALSGRLEARPTLKLKGGLNRIEVTYESPPSGEAWLRLFWSNDKLVPEPVPPTMLVHEAGEAELRRGEKRRLGRQLFATRHCAKCHVPFAPFENAMPELAAEAPSLDEAGQRFNSDWLVRWMKQPKTIVPETIMPAALSEDATEAETQARDVAAYLATLLTRPLGGGEGRGEGAALNSPDLIKTGEATFAKLGCVACHFLPNDKRLDGDTRRPLGHVRAKWQPPALVEYLRAPGKLYPWTPMPDFQLTAAEAESLAAFVISRGEPPEPEDRLKPGLRTGDAKRGQETVLLLGCVNCHAITGAKKPGIAGRLEALADKEWRTGCLADRASQRGKAVDFGFTTNELAALRHVVRHDLASLRRDTWPEFAERQMTALRCTACHQRENAKDFWFSVESAEAAGKPKVKNPYDDDETQDTTIHRQRPLLTWTGEKLRPEWMEQLFLGKLSYKPRPKLEARMPAFPSYARGLAVGLAMDHGCGAQSPELPPVDPVLARTGQALIVKGALGCVDCHAVGRQPALAGTDTATINFAHVPERLRRDYYDRYVFDPLRLLPGTMMPKFVDDAGLTGVTAHFGGDARKQFDAIWNYMRTVRIDQ